MWIKQFIIYHFLVSLLSLYFLIRNGSRPYRILAWMMTILALPVIGAIFYFLLGVNRRKLKLFNRKLILNKIRSEQFLGVYEQEIEKRNLMINGIDEKHRKLVRLLTHTNKTPLTINNHVAILNDGLETFESIFEACEKAKEYIHLEYYIFLDGELADRFADIFRRKVQEGVKVRMIYDGFGSWSLSNKFIRKLENSGVEVFPFFPLRLGAMGRTNYRNHRKIIVVDSNIGFTGGINVDDKYIKGDPALGHWKDTHLRMEGLGVNFLNFIFLTDWYFVSGHNLLNQHEVVRVNSTGITPIQIVTSGPDSDHANILHGYLHILNAAQEYVYIANPYFVPNEPLLLALKSCALSDVDVRLVLPEKSDSQIIDWATRSYFDTLLEAGVQIYLYQTGFLHSKIILSDDAICSIGTANLDIRSFEQNFEVNALLYDKSCTLELKKQFFSIIEDSKLIDGENYKLRPRKDRIRENLARLVSPVM